MFKRFNIAKIIILVSTIFVIPTLNIYWYEEDSITFSNQDVWSYKIYSSDDEITLQNLIIKFKKGGYYKIHIEDMDWNESDIEINVNEDWSENSHWSAEKQEGSSTNKNLEIAVSPVNPYTSDWVNLIIKTDNNYTGKIKFSELEYRSNTSPTWTSITGTSNDYVSDYSDIWGIWYYKLSLSDKGEVILGNLVKFKKSGYYRLSIEDDSWNRRSQQITVNTDIWEEEVEKIIDELLNTENNNYEIYESRSCEKYRIEFNEELSAYTSPDLKTTEYFINTDYFKRYIDSKNAQNASCSSNKSWISSPYVDNNTGTNFIVAPNGKIYFTTQTDWWYTSSQLKSGSIFSTFDELRLFINEYNPLTELN